MLFDKSINDLTINDINLFCENNGEGYRIEYKSSFDDNVRRKIPQIVSSFANSHGGVLIIGVRTNGNRAILPIAGIERPDREEITLTIQNLCRDNIYPAIFPIIKEITAEQNNIVIIVFVEESIDSPHAIENKRKVYIRTGDSAEPHDLCDLQRMRGLFEKKDQSKILIENLEKRSFDFLKEPISNIFLLPHLRIIITPTFPRNKIINKNDLYNFCRNLRTQTAIRYDDLFAVANLKRISDGICGHLPGRWFFYLNMFGFLSSFHISNFRNYIGQEGERQIKVINFSQTIEEIAYNLHLMKQLFITAAWDGNVLIKFSFKKVKDTSLSIFNDDEITTNIALEDDINSFYETDSFNVKSIDNAIISNLLYDAIWSFYQFETNPYYDAIQNQISELIPGLGLN